MKLYLSSFEFGDEIKKLGEMLPLGGRIGHINNARDWVGADLQIKARHQQSEINQLSKLGFIVEIIDLQNYFGKESELRQTLKKLDGIWVSGGNTFVLRQAMKLSGFDTIFKELQQRDSFLYGGYSAGVCVLCDSLKYIQNVDDPNNFPYKENTKTIWEGLNYFNYGIIPHYRSNHAESEMVEQEVENCIHNKWLFKTLKDGEVMIIE